MRDKIENDTLDRQLDAALAKYATVEPRAGLEGRILANLGAQRETSGAKGWWRWASVGAVALLMLVLGVALLRRTERAAIVTTGDHVVKQSQEIQTGRSPVGPALPAKPAASVRTGKARPPHHARPVVASSPRMPEFPSPAPLTEQEKILAQYVAKYPEHAALIAEARTEELHRDEEEMAEPMISDDSSEKETDNR